MYRRIIVGFDGAPYSLDALALALRLRDPDGGMLTLACALTVPAWHVSRPRRADEAVREDVAPLLDEARATLPPGIPVQLRSPASSSPARALTELAEAEAADLIVVGAGPASRPGQLTLGRTGRRLLLGGPCAVALAPADWREDAHAFRHVGVAYDGSPESETALTAAYSIAAASGAAVTLLWAFPERGALRFDAAAERGEQQARTDARARLDAAADAAPAGVNPRALVVTGPPADAIASAVDGVVDVLLTGSRGYGPVERVVLGSVSERLADGAHHPVLVLPRRRTSRPAGDAPAAAASATAT
jgi:nucleotide-binding universal stress UspA family protein